MSTQDRSCPNCGHKDMIRFDSVMLNLRDKGTTQRIDDMSGWRCSACSEWDLDKESLLRYAEASDALLKKRQTKRLRGGARREEE